MTCVVGIADGERVWMGADSASADGWTVRETRTPKLFGVGEVLIGYTVSWRMGQILETQLELPEMQFPPGCFVPDALRHETDLYVRGPLIDAIRRTLHDYHYSTEKDNRQEGCGLLIGYRGHLFQVNDDFGMVEHADGCDAVGCGAEYALGSLYCSGQFNKAPQTRLMLAMEAACHFSGGVKEPAHYARLLPGGTIVWEP